MKFLCPACQSLSEIAAVRAEGATVVFTCGSCGNDAVQATPTPPPVARKAVGGGTLPMPRFSPEAAVAPESSAPPRPRVVVPLRKRAELDPAHAADPFFIPSDLCPKCLAPRNPKLEACARCGLHAAQVSAGNFQPPEEIRLRWQALWESWDDPLLHERFRQDAFASGDLHHAGRLYQLRLVRAPGDVNAERGRGEILRLVSTVAAMQHKPAPNTRKIRQIGWATVMLFVTVLAAGLAKALLLQR